uniref:Reverse transcriptase n=1 Tax=Phytophthora ramorum TaxID=164328 RepID=H3H555_PHYRM
MTIDTRSVNERTEPMPWPMPVLEVVIGELEGAKVFFVLDWFRGYWQLPLHPDSQEIYSFVTHRGIYTPTRVPMGATDAVAYCQGVVEEIFGDLLGTCILAWLDDILGYAEDEASLLEVLDKVLERCEKFGLKLHAKKCQFFATEVKWCGRMISAQGVRHCPERIQGLVEMQAPQTAGDLQQFLCAVNWMRQSIPEFTRITAVLYDALDRAAQIAGSRKKVKLARVRLEDVSWGADEMAGVEAVRDALLNMVPLAHPSPTADLCLYSDASNDYWGAVVTMLDPEELKLPRAEQHHRPLAFLSGRFVGAAQRWPTIEKEAFAIVEAVRRLEYLLLRPRGFHLFTDHRNLVYIFNPYATDGMMARYQADKLQRWALALMSFRYVIEHVPGEENAWGDLLSRWGAGPPLEATRTAIRAARLAVVERVSPLEEADFVWPSEQEIRAVQQAAGAAAHPGVQWNEERQLQMTSTGQVWIPPDSGELQQRLCVVAHAGASGHRGAAATLKSLSTCFFWPTMGPDVTTFVNECLHCMVAAGGRIPRPFGETLRATRPNEVLHFDFLTMIMSTSGVKYVLVLKDGMSGFVELLACTHATSDHAYQGLIDWFKRFGVVHQWVSDQGAHFRNQVVERLQRALGAHHHFTTAYTPWANGTVEVVNREVLKSVKALLSERRMHVQDWPAVLPVVQAALNAMPADRLDGRSPLTAFTALPADSQLRSILHPRSPTQATLEWVDSEVRSHLTAVREALDNMHAEMVSASEKRRRAARERHARRQGVRLHKFSEGDFVLAATATGRSGHKLALVWRGPKRILKALNDYTFEVQDIIEPFAVTIRHASRLQLYRDAARGRVEELQEQAIYGEGGHLVEALLDCRLSPDSHRWEVFVKWFGLDDIEASWEPADIIKQDVPGLFQVFVDDQPEARSRRDMAAALAGPDRDDERPAQRAPRRRQPRQPRT